jgi:allantoicase
MSRPLVCSSKPKVHLQINLSSPLAGQSNPDDCTAWTRILDISELGASAHHYCSCHSTEVRSHPRLNIFPDGGVARLRVYGAPSLDRSMLGDKVIDLAAALSGGRVIGFSDARFRNSHRVIMPDPVRNMGDGWDTQRPRKPGHEWIVLALGGRGVIDRIAIDTPFLKGNYPEFVSIQAGDPDPGKSGLPSAVVNSAAFWQEIFPQQSLSADAVQEFLDLNAIAPVTHLRVNIFPDGGLARRQTRRLSPRSPRPASLMPSITCLSDHHPHRHCQQPQAESGRRAAAMDMA